MMHTAAYSVVRTVRTVKSTYCMYFRKTVHSRTVQYNIAPPRQNIGVWGCATGTYTYIAAANCYVSQILKKTSKEIIILNNQFRQINIIVMQLNIKC